MDAKTPRRRWRLLPQDPDRARALAAGLNAPPTIGQLLLNRGVTDIASGQKYLDRKLTALNDPLELPGVSEAADVLMSAISSKKNICIYGDYDVDGMCSTAILYECLRIAGAKPTFYVPDRLEEGYGVNSAALQTIRGNGADVVVTVDCGIASIEEAEEAKRLGLDYIVSDHHCPKETLPCAQAIIHPNLPDRKSPFADLCGAGVAYKLAWELARRVSGSTRVSDDFRRFLLDATALAAVATVCDVVPLHGENRVLVHHGLNVLAAEPPIGLRSLIRHSGIGDKKRLTTGDVGFTIGPRLNACGRLGTARLGVELLTTRDVDRAAKLAEYLDEQNKQRQLLERRMFLRARELVEQRFGTELSTPLPAIVLADEYAPDRWHPGVLGIVAGRMAERFHCPCILLAFSGDSASGSGRSVSGFDLFASVECCHDHFTGFGGHAMAVGVRLSRDQFEGFQKAFESGAASLRPEANRVSELRLDAEVSLPMLNHGLIQALEVMEPFGLANPSPLLLATGLVVVDQPSKVGNGERHLSFRVQPEAGGPVRKAIGFEMADRADELMSAGGKCCLAFTPTANEFRGFTSVDLRLRDLRPGSKIGSTDE